MEPGDLDRMYALDVLCFPPPFRFSRAAMRRFALAENALVRFAAQQLKLEDEPGSGREQITPEDLLGFCIVHLMAPPGRLAAQSTGLTGYVVTLDVDPGYRGRGIASRLMEELHESAGTSGADQMSLHVFAENQPAIRLYERLGYRFKERSFNFYGRGLDALGYGRSLARPF